MGSGRGVARWQALPNHAVIILPTAHACLGEVLKYRLERAQLVHAQNHVIAYQWNHKEVQHELFVIDGETRILADVVASHLIVVGHLHSKTWPMDRKKVQATRGLHGNKGVR
jgi:hypothetical protein